MACGVIDCSQRRFTGCLFFASWQRLVKNQFALAASVAGIDDLVDILARDQLLETIEYVPLNPPLA